MTFSQVIKDASILPSDFHVCLLPVVWLSPVLFHCQAVHVGRQVCIVLQSVTPGSGHL